MSETMDVLVWNTRDPLLGRTVDQFEAALRERLSGASNRHGFLDPVGQRHLGPILMSTYCWLSIPSSLFWNEPANSLT